MVAALFDEMEAYARPAGACGLASVYTSTSRAVAVPSLLTSTASHLREMGTHRLRASVPTCVGTPPVTDEHPHPA